MWTPGCKHVVIRQFQFEESVQFFNAKKRQFSGIKLIGSITVFTTLQVLTGSNAEAPIQSSIF